MEALLTVVMSALRMKVAAEVVALVDRRMFVFVVTLPVMSDGCEDGLMKVGWL